ncbi:MAG: ABC transporter ATP-binding protein/permease, partial [Oscillospiraceae bacterium]|nr:ABC transporter ATP-binding protein/permease [Oscillospiraceae bacterium]
MARNKFDIDETLEAPFSLKNLKNCMIYVTRRKNMLIIAFLVQFISSAASLYTPKLIQKATDAAIPNQDVSQLLWLCAGLFGCVAVSVAAFTVRSIIMTRVSQQIVCDIRSDLFAHLQRLPFSYYDSRPHGKILVRVVHYVNAVSDTLSNGVLNLIAEILNLLIIAVFMFTVSAQLSLVVLAGLPVLAIAMMIIMPRQRRGFQQISNKNSNMNAFFQESVEGVRVTQTFNRQERNAGIMDTLIKKARRVWIRTMVISNLSWMSVGAVSQLCFTFVYIAGVYWLGGRVEFGVLLAMGMYSARFWQPIINLANIYNQFINAIAYLERIFETMNEPPVVQNLPDAADLPTVTGRVEFKDVWFEYEPGQPVLRGVNFVAQPGESIAFVGPTGAGKTTVVNLISRFYNIERGQVLIDGQDIMKVTLQSLRSQMGIMLQDSFIFSGTVAENLRYGRLNATDEEIMEAARQLQCSDFIERMHNGYQAEIKERGGGLSQGQKQLLSFARTLLADPKILILDEATSSIDTATERLVQEAIQTLLRDRTSFIIAHRLST